MFTRFIKTICLILVAALLFNILPAQAFALQSTEITQQAALADDAPLEILAEVEEKRTEYSKEFVLSNGLHMAQLYGSAVHYEENGQWKEIDNTLKTSGIGLKGVLTNTQGPWQVSFPQIMGSGSAVSVTKDGYTLSFSFAGKLSASGGAQLMAAQSENFSLTTGSSAAARVEKIDLTEVKASAQFAETVPDKLHSRVAYNSIYNDTNIVYDLQSNKIKESIVMNAYDDALRGYRYTLSTGSLIPILGSDGHIDFYDEKQENIILVMPAPFLVDAENVYNYDIKVTLNGADGTYTLSYILPYSWLGASDRAWPVVLDPIIQPSMDINNVRDRSVGSKSNAAQNAATLDIGVFSGSGKTRAFLKYANLPVLSSADVVVYADVSLYKTSNQTQSAPIEVHKVLGNWDSSTVTWANQPDYNNTVEDYVTTQASGWYTWDVTDIARQWYATGNNYGMVFKVPESIENSTTQTNPKEFWSADYGVASVMPTLRIYFSNTNGLESYWDYAAASAGRAGTGYVNTYTGNLVWTREHMGFGGSTMPVTISHVYNANDCYVPSNSQTATATSGNYFDMGYGWRTNIHQRVYAWGNYYVWEDADGTDHFFELRNGVYMDEDGSGRKLTIQSSSNNARYIIQEKDSDILTTFDQYGRLVRICNSQQTPSNIWVDYLQTPGPWPSQVTDGAGRVYKFSYNGYVLTRIGYYGTGSTELAWVSFGYSNNNLTSITDWEGNVSTFTYNDHILTSVKEDNADSNSYRLQYTYHPVTDVFQAHRVASVTEYDGTAQGSSLTFTYEDNRTVLTDNLQNKQILLFNNFGNVLSVQDDEGHAQYARFARNVTTDTGMGNQLLLSSNLQNTVVNMLQGSSFESAYPWVYTTGTTTPGTASRHKYLGNSCLQVVGRKTIAYSGIQLKANKTYTFSAYVKTVGATAKLGIGSKYSEILPDGNNWTRMQVSYTPTADETVSISVSADGSGSAYLDCVQLEQAATASRYNLVENGDFRLAQSGAPAYGWTGTNLEAADVLTTQTPDAPQLGDYAFSITGNIYSQKSIRQNINVTGTAGDSFVLSGWGKGDSVPLRTENNNARQFGLKLTFHYTETVADATPVIVSFTPDNDHWQYVSAPAVAQGAYDYVTVELLYDYNANTAYFDNIQLFKEEFGTSYTYDDSGNVISTVDLQKKNTTYEYNTNNDLTKIIQDGSTKMTYTYDSWRNVKTAKTQLGQVYNFTYDTYGNNTKVSITAGSKTLCSSAEYTTDGQRLVSTTDAANNKTQYSYNADTGLLEWVQYPKDTASTRTEYTYDAMFRMARAEMDVNSASTLSANYTYEDGKLKTIQTPSTTYTFTYGAFDLRTKVAIGSRTLASYTYDTHYRLQRLDYGNSDKVQYTYDDQSRVTRETYEDGAYVAYTYDNDGNLATVYDSATGITTTYYYDLLGRALYYTKANSGGVIQKVQYTYDAKNNLTGLTDIVGSSTQGYGYTYDSINRITSMTVGSTTVTYTYDAFNRLTKRETKQGSTVVKTETYTYVNPTSAISSLQVATYKVQTGSTAVTYSYTYDANGNILSVSDGTYTTSYVYDAANQLVRENNQAGNYTHTWEYDNAGNIKNRKKYAYTTGTLGSATSTAQYTYGNTSWKDLLTAYNGKNITYDTIGNPLTWGSRTLTWQRGRQLATLKDGTITWTYTYDADGMRTKRTNGTTTYAYTYNGSQLAQMTVGSNTLRFTYDSAGTPLSVTYNGTVYYYVTNLQGDVVAIVNASGVEQVKYTYDAWGKLLSTTGTLASSLGAHNPLRYRGYVYDTETALYYLQSRYYDPDAGRFINADGYTTTGQKFQGNNMFSYCINNPVCMADYIGEDAIYVVDFEGGRGLPIVGHAYVYLQDDEGNWYKTEYAGNFPDKSTAHIRTTAVTDEQMIEIEKMLHRENLPGINYGLIIGDFSNSVEMSYHYNSTNYGGYNLLTNNCMHYAQDILLAGTPKLARDYLALSIFDGCVPMDFLAHLKPGLRQELNMKSISSGLSLLKNVATNMWNALWVDLVKKNDR